MVQQLPLYLGNKERLYTNLDEIKDIYINWKELGKSITQIKFGHL